MLVAVRIIVIIPEKLSLQIFFEKAENLHNEKEYSQAIIYYSKALEIDNRSYLIYYKKGRCHEENGEKQEALKEYTNALDLKNNHFNSYYWRGSVNYDLNDYQAASIDWQSALELNSENNSTLYWIAKSQFNLSNYKAALSFIDKYLTKENKDKEAYILRGECYAQTNQIGSAKTDWQKAEDLGHNNITYYLRKYGLTDLN